jgi:hypothetical protein
MFHKILNDKWTRGVVIFSVIFIPLFFIAVHYGEKAEDTQFKSDVTQENSEIKAEVQRRQSERSKSYFDSEPNIINPDVSQDVGFADNNVTDPIPNVSTSAAVKDPGDAMITQGPHKGMTVREFEEHKKFKAAEKKVWDRYKVYLKKQLAYTDSLLASSRKERVVILSVFKNFSPDQLEYARKELIKTIPEDEEKINDFFNDIANHPNADNEQEFTKAAQDILLSDEALAIVGRELDIEHEFIQQEFEYLKKRYGH